MNFFTKSATSAILDDRKSLSIAFLVISEFQINTQLFFIFFYKITNSGHFGWPKITFDRISRHFRSICNFQFFWFFLQNRPRRPFLMTDNHFRSHFSSFKINTQLYFFSQNRPRWPFWMTENLFWSHFTSFQINTQLLIFGNYLYKMAAGGHFGWPKITFDRISRHFRSIRYFKFLAIIFTKW